jgi:hypothetical protein
MKKILFKGLIVMAALSFASSAFANGSWVYQTTPITDSAGGPSITDVSLSPKVEYFYTSATGAGYAIGTRNLQGTKTYAINSDYANIYMADDITSMDPAEGSSAFSGAGWTAVIK